MVLTGIELITKFSEEQQLMKLTFDNGKDSAYIIWEHASLLQYLNSDVIATFRRDMYNGHVEKFINTIARLHTIQTVERAERARLFTDVEDNQSNITFSSIEEGTTATDAIVYVLRITYDSSSKADWADLTIQDRQRKIATLRIFSPDKRIEDLNGHYILTNIRRNKYGFSTDTVVTVDSQIPLNPEVEIAERFIEQAFDACEDIKKFLASSQFFEYAKEDVQEERGYILVRLAIELSLAMEMDNLMKEVNIETIKICLLLEKLHLMSASQLHPELVSYALAQRYSLSQRTEAIHTLYSEDPAYNKERTILAQIKSMADAIVKIKKGVIR